ncbi:MAG TPA: NAD(P)H-dependent oxidoreductase [Candidatus Scatovivens faecipullorum]|nr:NAD(P)H-dependent oxidoreductase [Candidatus Scatovivens faecipullorum]
MSKILVSYFSASGVTKKVAVKVAESIKADLFEIEPVQKYTDEDLNWHDKKSRSSIEMQDKTSRPEIRNTVSNIDEYDTIIIGFPVWWYTAPTIINTFIEENNLEGKNVYVFVTSGGSSSQGSFKDLKNTYKNLDFISDKRFKGNENPEEYINWIK